MKKSASKKPNRIHPDPDHDERPAKAVSMSKVEMTELVFPNDANPLGNVMGGRVMHWIDICAAISAQRHAGRVCVTASVDRIDFEAPAHVGEVLVLLASVNYAGRTSMEIGVKVYNEDRATGNRSHVASAYLTFVSLDPDTHTPRTVPRLISESAEEKRRCQDAVRRRDARIKASQA